MPDHDSLLATTVNRPKEFSALWHAANNADLNSLMIIASMEGYIEDCTCADGTNALALAMGYRNQKFVNVLLHAAMISHPVSISEEASEDVNNKDVPNDQRFN